MSKFGPRCDACVDYYLSECHCQRSVYCGMSMPNLPWEGCSCFLSRRKWGGNSKPKKRRKKHPSMEEFEFGV